MIKGRRTRPPRDKVKKKETMVGTKNKLYPIIPTQLLDLTTRKKRAKQYGHCKSSVSIGVLKKTEVNLAPLESTIIASA